MNEFVDKDLYIEQENSSPMYGPNAEYVKRIIIRDKKCEVYYAAGKNLLGTPTRVRKIDISNLDYQRLLRVLDDYKSLLGEPEARTIADFCVAYDTKRSTFKYVFDGKENKEGTNPLFKSLDKELENKANAEYFHLIKEITGE